MRLYFENGQKKTVPARRRLHGQEETHDKKDAAPPGDADETAKQGKG